MYGYQGHEILGRNLSALWPSDGEPALQPERLIERSLRDGLCDAVVAFRRKDGKVVTRPVSVVPWRRDSGELSGFLIIAAALDPSASSEPADSVRSLRARIETMDGRNRAKDHFLERVLHDLRTLLGGIIGFSATLLMRLPGPLTVGQEKQLNTIETCAQELLHHLNRLPDMLRIETGTIDVKVASVSCRTIIAEAVRGGRERAKAKGLAFEEVFPDGDVTLRTDPWILEQIVIRLVENAVAYTGDGGVVVTCDRPVKNPGQDPAQDPAEPPGAIRVQVRDTGPGLSLADQDKLFRPFTQLRSLAAGNKRGTGLGLYQSRKLAGLTGGELSCASVPGQGSVFTLILPEGVADGADAGD